MRTLFQRRGCYGRGADRGFWHHHFHQETDPGAEGMMGGHFGVRRPLRFLTYKLGLDDQQKAELARILDELKTVRAQASVDDRRTVTNFADAVAGENFDAELARQGAERRRESAAQVSDALAQALGEIHALLDSEQRKQFGYLIRTRSLFL